MLLYPKWPNAIHWKVKIIGRSCAEIYNTHTHPFNCPFSRTTRVSRYQKGKTSVDFAAPRSRQITMPAPHHSVFHRPDALPAAQPTASMHCDIQVKHLNDDRVTMNFDRYACSVKSTGTRFWHVQSQKHCHSRGVFIAHELNRTQFMCFPVGVFVACKLTSPASKRN